MNETVQVHDVDTTKSRTALLETLLKMGASPEKVKAFGEQLVSLDENIDDMLKRVRTLKEKVKDLSSSN